MAKFPPIDPESTQGYDAWFRAKIESRQASKLPGIPHDQAMARMQAILGRRKLG